MQRTFLTAEWRKLVMANYVVSPELLQSYIPNGTELDFFHDRCYVSLVSFLFHNTRLRGWRIPFHQTFEEINLRFYVRRIAEDGEVRRGVVFIREFVPRFALSFVARTVYQEPYRTVPTSRAWHEADETLTVEYRWRYAGRSHTLQAVAAATPQPMTSGSEEEFMTEHYWGYTRLRNGNTSEYAVEHPRWLTYPLQKYRIDVDFAALYGEPFGFLNQLEPASVLLAEGSEVAVRDAVKQSASRDTSIIQ